MSSGRDAEKQTATQDLSSIVDQIFGKFGRWQLRSVLLLFFCKIPPAWFMGCIVFTAPSPKIGEFYCNSTVGPPKRNFVGLENVQNVTTIHRQDVDVCGTSSSPLHLNWEYFNYTNIIDQHEGDALRDVHTYSSEYSDQPCEHFVHISNYTTLVTQFDLFCSREIFVCVTQSFHVVGAVFGGLIAVEALKHYSPRNLILLGIIFQIIFGNLTGLAPTLVLHAFFRCLTSLFCIIMVTSGQIILTDITSGKAKIIALTMYDSFWSVGLLVLPVIASNLHSWVHLYIALSTLLSVLLVLYRWMPDSPIWLLEHNKLANAKEIFHVANQCNNIVTPTRLFQQLEVHALKQQQLQKDILPYWSIWSGGAKKKHILLLHIVWGWVIVLYNILLLMIGQLGVEHIYWNTAFLDFAELIGIFIGLILVLHTKRRWLWGGTALSVVGALTFTVWLDSLNAIVDSKMLFWLALKLVTSLALAVLTAYSASMVHLEQRAVLMVSVNTYSRSLLKAAPFISQLNPFNQLIPITIFASMAVSGGFIMMYLDRIYVEKNKKAVVLSCYLNQLKICDTIS